MKKLILTMLTALMAVLGVGLAGPALAAGGYVLNNSSASVYGLGTGAERFQLRPGESSALYVRDANGITVASGMCMQVGSIKYRGPQTVSVADNTVRTVSSYVRC